MVAIEHRQNKPTVSTTSSADATVTATSSVDTVSNQEPQAERTSTTDIAICDEMTQQEQTDQDELTTTNIVRVQQFNKMSKNDLNDTAPSGKSAATQRNVDLNLSNKSQDTKELSKKMLKLDLTAKDLEEYTLKSPKSPISARLPPQTTLASSVEVEDRKTLREALYQGIFHRHRRTIFAVGSFLRMLRSRNSQYNTIRSSSEGEETEERR